MDFREMMLEAATKADISLSTIQVSRLERYFELLTEWNEKVNLTAITDMREVINKHFIDSLLIFKYADIPQGASVIDIGTGAGFPGVIMAIYRPDLKLTLLDSLNKRIMFLEELCNQLNLKVTIMHDRAEDGGRNEKTREKYDVVVSRAVAYLSTLVEYCVPYLKLGGTFYAMKGPQVPEEAESARRAVDLLGGRIVSINNYGLPSGDGRAIVTVRKVKSTPIAYPRQTAKIKSKPL